MQFNVAELLKEPIGATRRYTIDQRIRLPEEAPDAWVQGEVRLLKTDRGVVAVCSLETTADCLCSRCLAPFQQPLRLVIEEEYLPTVDLLTGVRLLIPDQETFSLDEHHVLDIQEAFRQYLLVNLPLQPLCRESCAGLCPDCGMDLNEDACVCPQRLADPRWTPLLQAVTKLGIATGGEA